MSQNVTDSEMSGASDSAALTVEAVRTERQVSGDCEIDINSFPERPRERSVSFETRFPDGSVQIVECSPEVALRLAAAAADAAQAVACECGEF